LTFPDLRAIFLAEERGISGVPVMRDFLISTKAAFSRCILSGDMAVEVWGFSVYNIIGLVYPGTGGTETLAGLPDSGEAPCRDARGVGEALPK